MSKLCGSVEKMSRVALLVCILIVQFAYAHSISGSSNRNSNSLSSATVMHQNTLTDEIGHEEFIDSESQQPHSRKKRLVWITDDGRLALPPGTSLTFTPTIAMPMVRHPPEGFFSNMSISFPLTIDFDKLGLTDNQNPLGDLPPIFARSFGHTAGEMLGNYVARYLHVKAKRDLAEQTQTVHTRTRTRSTRNNAAFQINEEATAGEEHEYPELPQRFKHVFHGGERVMLYGVVEDFLTTFGMNGKACLLRFICEIHSRQLEHFGVFGEMIKLFLTVTKSPFSGLLPDYVKAQEIGEGRTAPGECFPYYKECSRSVFKTSQTQHHYTAEQKGEYYEQEVELVKRKNIAVKNQKVDDLTTNEIDPQHLLPM